MRNMDDFLKQVNKKPDTNEYILYIHTFLRVCVCV